MMDWDWAASSMGYTDYDFEETLSRCTVDKANIARVLKAWGQSPEGYGSWEGGFLLELKDGSQMLITGWCDTTGWGCQDGVEVFTEFTPDQIPDFADVLPADLNLWLVEKVSG